MKVDEVVAKPKVQDRTPDPVELEKLRDAGRQFESVFMYTMIQAMRKTVHKSKFLNGGFAEDTWTSMLDQELSNSSAKASSMRIADVIVKRYQKYLKTTEGDSSENASSAALCNDARAHAKAGEGEAAAAKGCTWTGHPGDVVLRQNFKWEAVRAKYGGVDVRR